MPPTLKFFVTPLNPFVIALNRVTREWAYIAFLRSFGVTMWTDNDRSLRGQYNQDKTYLFGAFIGSPAPTTMPSPFYRYSCAQLSFRTDATTVNQCLLKYHLKGLGGAKAAFYLNGNLVGSEQVDGDKIIELQMDCPPPQTWWYAYMFSEGFGRLELKKIECYIL